MPFLPVRRDPRTSAFFDGTARSEFLIVHDKLLNRYLGPDRDVEIEPGRYELVPAVPMATVVSWTVLPAQNAAGEPPTVVGLIQLDDGPWWWTEIIGADPATDLRGAPLKLEFVESGNQPDDEVLPQWSVINKKPRPAPQSPLRTKSV